LDGSGAAKFVPAEVELAVAKDVDHGFLRRSFWRTRRYVVTASSVSPGRCGPVLSETLPFLPHLSLPVVVELAEPARHFTSGAPSPLCREKRLARLAWLIPWRDQWSARMCVSAGMTRLRSRANGMAEEDTMFHPEIAWQLVQQRQAELMAQAAHNRRSATPPPLFPPTLG
jgi:hypothetical protein